MQNQITRQMRRYSDLKATGHCTACGIETEIGKIECRLCLAKKVCHKEQERRQIPLRDMEFVDWYIGRTEQAAGHCEWCGASFSAAGMRINYDGPTGCPKALICCFCDVAQQAGIERLERIVAVLRRETQLFTISIKFSAAVFFERWKWIIHRSASREKALRKIMREIRTRFPSQDETEKCYAEFIAFVNEQETHASE